MGKVIAVIAALFVVSRLVKANQPQTMATVLQFPSPAQPAGSGQNSVFVTGNPEPVTLPLRNPDTLPNAWPGLNPTPNPIILNSPSFSVPVGTGLPVTYQPLPVAMQPNSSLPMSAQGTDVTGIFLSKAGAL